jgi:hypothetical protein
MKDSQLERGPSPPTSVTCLITTMKMRAVHIEALMHYTALKMLNAIGCINSTYFDADQKPFYPSPSSIIYTQLQDRKQIPLLYTPRPLLARKSWMT